MVFLATIYSHFGNINLFGWLGLSLMSGSDSDGYVGTVKSYVAAVADIMLVTHGNPEISLLVSRDLLTKASMYSN